MQQKRLEVELPQTYRVYYPHVSKKLFALCNFLGRVDICVIIVICQHSPYLIGNGQK